MNFTVERRSLMSALTQAMGIVDNKGILANILLESDGGEHLKFTATDYDVVMRGRIPAQVKEPGRICIDPKIMLATVKNWSQPTMTARLKDDRLKCKCGKTTASLLTFVVEDFPVIDKEVPAETIGLDASDMGALMSKVAPFMSDDPLRINLNGALLSMEQDDRAEDPILNISLVATDGHRLGQLRTEIALDVSADHAKIERTIHRKGVKEIAKLLSKGAKGDVAQFAVANDEIVVTHDETTLFIRCIDYDFPNYKGIIPSDCACQYSIDKHQLTQAVQIAASLADKFSCGVRVEPLEEGDGKFVTLQVAGSNAATGNVTTDIQAEYEGNPFPVGFNFVFMGDALRCLPDGDVIIRMTGPDSPMLLHSANAGELDRFVIMPMEIS